jgi:hypothetical protein
MCIHKPKRRKKKGEVHTYQKPCGSAVHPSPTSGSVRHKNRGQTQEGRGETKKKVSLKLA